MRKAAPGLPRCGLRSAWCRATGRRKFDLIVFSEVLYFLNQADVRRRTELAREALLPGGCVLLVNYTAQIDEPCSGDEAAELFIAASALPWEHSRDRCFRIDFLGAQSSN